MTEIWWYAPRTGIKTDEMKPAGAVTNIGTGVMASRDMELEWKGDGVEVAVVTDTK